MYFPDDIFKTILNINTMQIMFQRKMTLFKPIHRELMNMHPGDNYRAEISYYILAKIDGMPDLVSIRNS